MGDEKKFNTDKLVVQNLMKNENGRDYMWKKLQSMGVFENIFTDNAHQHTYQSGRRAAGLELDADLREYASDEYIKMIKENL